MHSGPATTSLSPSRHPCPTRSYTTGPATVHQGARCHVKYTGFFRVEFYVLPFPPRRLYCIVYFTSSNLLHCNVLHVVQPFELKLSSSSKSKRVSWELHRLLNHRCQGAIDMFEASRFELILVRCHWSLVLFVVALGTLQRSDATSYLHQGGLYTFRTSLITVYASAESK